MNITHVIRGYDHKINAFKQIMIYQYMGWKLPKYFHIPLIHSEDGKKLSKRDNASTTEDYKKIGILPIALRNYLLRLGWSYKDKEIFNDEESIKYFSLKNIGKSPSKLDFERIKSLNEFYIKNLNENILIENLITYIKTYKKKLDDKIINNITSNINILKNKAKTLEDIYNNSNFIYDFQKKLDVINDKNKTIVNEFYSELVKLKSYDEEKISQINQDIIKNNNIKFKDLGQPLRLILTGSDKAPSIKDIIKILGISETINRIKLHIS